MADISFLINNQVASPPKNYKGLELLYEWFNTGRASATLNTPEFEWIKTEFELIQQWRQTHGLLEGVPLKIELDGEAFFNGYVDTSSERAVWGCNSLTAPSVADEDPENLRTLAQSFTFAYLESRGYIKPSDFVPVHYQIHKRIETERVFMLSLALFMVSRELVHITIEIAKAVSQLAGGITIVVSILHLVLMLAYAVILVIYLVDLIKQIIDLFFSPPRYYHAMTIKRLFEVGCNFLGLKFESSLFNRDKESRMVILPAKFQQGALVGRKSNDKGYPEKTFLAFIEDCILQFNARIRILNGVMYFERRDHTLSYSGVSFKDVPGKDRYRTNASEWVSNWLLRIPSDSSDLHTTLQPGRFFQVTVKPQNVVNPRHVTLKGLEEINFAFALGVRKTQETKLERLIANIQTTADRLIEPINKLSPRRRRQMRERQGKGKFAEILSETSSDGLPVNPNTVKPEDAAAALPSRVNRFRNHLSLDEDYFTVDKLLVLNAADGAEGKLSVDNDALTAEYFWNNFYAIESIANGQNQFKLYEGVQLPLCSEDFKRLSESNLFYIESMGTQAELMRMVYNPFTQLATLDFRVAADLAGKVTETKTDGVNTETDAVEPPAKAVKVTEKFYFRDVSLGLYNSLIDTTCSTINLLPEGFFSAELYSTTGTITNGVVVYTDEDRTAFPAAGAYYSKDPKRAFYVSSVGIVSTIKNC